MSDDVEVKEQETEQSQPVEAAEQKPQKAEKQKPQKAQAKTVTNLRKNPVTIGSKSYKQGEECTLTEADLVNDRMMAKVNRLIELGILG